MDTHALWKPASVVLFSAALFLAPALMAQQAAPGDGAGESKSGPPAKAANSYKAAEAQQDNPAPTKPSSDPHIVPGSDYPHWEWFLGYSYVNGRVGSGIKSFNANGGSSSIAYNLNRWFGLVADLGGYHTGKIDSVNVDANEFSYLFGPRLNYRFGDRSRETLFGQILLGGVHGNASFARASSSANAFATTAGGGLDLGVSKHVAIRVAQLEYFLTNYDFGNGYRPQNNFRLSSGVLFRWGAKPVFRNRPPTVSCSTDVTSIIQGSGNVVPVRANASDPDNDPLTYTWTANGGHVEGNGPVARWTAGDAAPGTYTITVRVDDGHGGTATCSVNVHVEPRPLRPPTLTCSADRSSVLPGEVVNVTGVGSSPEGFPLEYTWRSNAGRVTGSGPRVQFDTTGLAPGSYSVTGRVTDGHGGAADCVAGVNVAAPPAKPQAVKVGECIFKKLGSSRVDNVCSRLLDDAVVRLQNDPKSTLLLIGHQDPVKEKTAKLAERRAENAKKYVTSKKHGIDPGRVSIRTEAGVAGADTANRRVEVIWLPEGASF